MAKIIYNNVCVVINDVQNRFEAIPDGKEVTVKMKVNRETNTFELTLPEKKAPAGTAPKPQRTRIYEDKNLNVTGTITTTDHLKVGVDLAVEKAMKVGCEAIETSLVKALHETFEECEQVTAA